MEWKEGGSATGTSKITPPKAFREISIIAYTGGTVVGCYFLPYHLVQDSQTFYIGGGTALNQKYDCNISISKSYIYIHSCYRNDQDVSNSPDTGITVFYR